MKKIKRELKSRGVWFSAKLPSYNKVLKLLFPQKAEPALIREYGPLYCSGLKTQGSKPPRRSRSGKKSSPSARRAPLAVYPAMSNRRAVFSPDIKPMVVCDRKLRAREDVKSWLRNYPVYFVTAGETLKDLKNFPGHINNVLKKTKNRNISGFISLGGGSVGDFTGFLAGVYKRGLPVAHIPSTWLSAMDSAHGGKTALNAGGVKNLIGSYFFPKAVFIVKELLNPGKQKVAKATFKGFEGSSRRFSLTGKARELEISNRSADIFSLPEKEKESAKGELIKIALIEGGALYAQLLKHSSDKWDLWKLLPQAIFAKLKKVQKDPFETVGERRLLNFGHTVGHALESYFRIPHGRAVLYGMDFAVQWSHSRLTLPAGFLKELSFLKLGSSAGLLKKIPVKTLRALLLRDKKSLSSKSLDFVFIKKPGGLFIEEVSFRDILKEVKRQVRCLN